jgi:hypothetical protein
VDCDFEACKHPAEYVSSRWTSITSDFPEDIQDLVDNKTISGDGILAEYWCGKHRPSNAISIREEGYP